MAETPKQPNPPRSAAAGPQDRRPPPVAPKTAAPEPAAQESAASSPPSPKRGGAVADDLRMRIDAGQTGDKVDHPDPAAAPLGTDAEAGGTPTDPAAMRRTAAKETARTPLAEDRPDPRTMQAQSARNRTVALLALVVVLGLLVLIWT